MLGILLIYFIGKRFYDLSEEYNQNKWLYAVLGVVMYYVGTFVGGFILGMLIALTDFRIDLGNNFLLALIVIPFGLLAVWGFYSLLKNRWKKSVVVIKDEIHDIGRDIQDEN